MMQDKDLPRPPGADVIEALDSHGFKIVGPPDEPMTAGDLATLLNTGINSGLIDPDKPIKLEDPNLMRPWDVRGVKTEGDELVLDVWGE